MFAKLGAISLVALVVVSGCEKKAQDESEMGMAQAAQQAGAAMADPVEYTIVFRNNWTRANHPFEYPEAGAVSGPHFSGIVGASHHASFALFREGSLPTPGLERLSEEGKPSPLDDEIRAALPTGAVGSLIGSGPLRDLRDSIVATVTVDAAHPLVSLVAMIAPSPDWFAGIAGVNLMENGAWVASRTLQLYAYDSGGDDGTTYKAADRDNNPKKPTAPAGSRHFVVNGNAVPVATVTLTRR